MMVGSVAKVVKVVKVSEVAGRGEGGGAHLLVHDRLAAQRLGAQDGLRVVGADALDVARRAAPAVARAGGKREGLGGRSP